jgi:LacI family transcriptional regulator
MRIAGFREALARHRVASPQKQVCIGDPADQSFVSALAKQADACVCANDHTAALLMRSFEALGVRVPRDVRVVGFDDTRYATLLAVPLTTMHQPCPDIGASAVQAMLERIRTPSLPARQIMLQAELVVRESCGARKR